MTEKKKQKLIQKGIWTSQMILSNKEIRELKI